MSFCVYNLYTNPFYYEKCDADGTSGAYPIERL